MPSPRYQHILQTPQHQKAKGSLKHSDLSFLADNLQNNKKQTGKLKQQMQKARRSNKEQLRLGEGQEERSNSRKREGLGGGVEGTRVHLTRKNSKQMQKALSKEEADQ